MSFDEKVFECNSVSDSTISCSYIIPKGSVKGVAFLMHGFSSSKRNSTNESLIPTLLAKALSVVRFDFMGHGDSSGPKEATTISTGVSNLEAVYEAFFEKNHQMVDLPVVLIGSSFGGAVAIASAAKVRCDGIVLKSPVWDIYAMQMRNRGEDVVKKWCEQGVLEIKGSKGISLLNYTYVSDSENYNLYEIAKTSGLPFYVVHGSNDEIAPIDQSQQAKQLLGDRCEFLEIEECDHRYSNEAYYQVAIDFCSTSASTVVDPMS